MLQLMNLHVLPFDHLYSTVTQIVDIGNFCSSLQMIIANFIFVVLE